MKTSFYRMMAYHFGGSKGNMFGLLFPIYRISKMVGIAAWFMKHLGLQENSNE